MPVAEARGLEVYLIEGMKKSEGNNTGDLINNKIIPPTLLRTAQVSDVRSSALMWSSKDAG